MFTLIGLAALAGTNSDGKGHSLEFECGRFDIGDRCSDQINTNTLLIDRCYRSEDHVSSDPDARCCRQFEIPFLNKNFDTDKPLPTVVVSVLRPPELAHAIFSTMVTRDGKREKQHESFVVEVTREDYCDKKDGHSWCANVELLWMAYGPAKNAQTLGTGIRLHEVRSPYQADGDWLPYLKKFPYRRAGEPGRNGESAPAPAPRPGRRQRCGPARAGVAKYPLLGVHDASLLSRKAAYYTHLSARRNVIGALDRPPPRPATMWLKMVTPTVLVATPEAAQSGGGAPRLPRTAAALPFNAQALRCLSRARPWSRRRGADARRARRGNSRRTPRHTQIDPRPRGLAVWCAPRTRR